MANTGQRADSAPDGGGGDWSPATVVQLAAVITELMSATEASTPSSQLGALVLCVGLAAILGRESYR